MTATDQFDADVEKPVYVTGTFRLDMRENRLTNEGVAIQLTGKPLELLELLMTGSQRLITKEEIFERVWQNRAISEAVLTTAIRQIRTALGDDARRPTMIETVHGKGYRFLPPVTVATSALPPSPAPSAPAPAAAPAKRRGRHKMTLTALAAAAVVALLLNAAIWGRQAAGSVSVPGKSIAVMPFADLSPEADAAWFAEGLSEEIVSSLSKSPDIMIASQRLTELATKDTAASGTLESRLGVANILEGSVRRTGGRVRVTARLYRIRDGFQLWTQSYDRAENDVISIQEGIAFDIARALDTVLDPEKLAAMVKAGTSSPAAYDAYLQGIAFGKRSLLGGDIEDSRRSSAAYELARKIDPSFSEAHWLAAQSWFANETRIDSNVFGEKFTREQRLAAYEERIDAAIATAKHETDALKYRSSKASMRLQLKPAHELMLKYLQARPRDLDAWEQLATLAAYAGDRGSVAHAAERIHTLSMESGWPWSRAVTISVMAMKPDLAARRAREQLKVSPDNATLNYQAQRAFLWSGAIDEARKSLDYVRSSTMEEENKLLAEMRQACAEGKTSDAAALGAKIEKIGEIATRWQANQLLGDYAAATKLLTPFDTAEGLPTLIQFMFQPTFDAREFPELMKRLETEGVRPVRPVAMPMACAAASPK
ncbi:MAG: winged helix-turn-helix domain-containing protein [Pseudomonadota bacterium]